MHICSSMSDMLDRVIRSLRESSSFMVSYNLNTAIVGPMLATIIKGHVFCFHLR